MTTKERSGSCTVTPSTRTAAESPMRDDLVYTLGIDKVLSPSSSSGGIVDVACLESRFIGKLSTCYIPLLRTTKLALLLS